jgi:uncharacterized SAM-binding protein YcdF (DUF218 family)
VGLLRKLFVLIKYLFWAGVLVSVVLGTIIGVFGITARPKKSDCIIILGCQVRGTTLSQFLKARLDKSIEIYNEGLAKYIIVSGGQGPGESITEAKAMEIYLVSNGIDENNIIMEEKSSNTMENLQYSKNIMIEMKLNTAIVVSNKYHLKRASVMAKRVGLNASYSGIFVSKYFFNEVYGFFREIPGIIRLYILGR